MDDKFKVGITVNSIIENVAMIKFSRFMDVDPGALINAGTVDVPVAGVNINVSADMTAINWLWVFNEDSSTTIEISFSGNTVLELAPRDFGLYKVTNVVGNISFTVAAGTALMSFIAIGD